MNVARLFEQAAQENPDRTAVHFPGIPTMGIPPRPISYKELSDWTGRFAGGLKALGLQPGDRFAVYMPNLPQFVISIWGGFQAGCVPSPMNPTLKKREIIHQITDSRSKLIIAPVLMLEEVAKAAEELPDLKVYVVGPGSDFPNFDELLKHPPHFVERADDDLALMPYTSGTTGKPKGVLLTHKNLSSNIRSVLKLMQARGTGERLLVPIPMFHITGMTVLMLTPLSMGVTIYPMIRWEAEWAMQLIQEHKITSMVCVPTLYIDLLNHPKAGEYDLSSLKLCSSGGAKMPVPLIEAMQKKLGLTVYEGYGLTETSPVTHTNLAAAKPKIGSIGWPIEGAECKIVDEQNKRLPIGQVGELCIRGPMVMKGYHNNPEATKQAIDSEGFFHTGDLGYVDEEGYYYIVDRVKDMINVGGVKVFPKEVEQVLYEHPAVAECAVVGMTDERKGETVKAYVVLKPGHMPSDKLAEEIQQHCLRELAAYKHPREIEFVQQLPKTASGKIQKYLLRGQG
ncbi:long-chain fatty acid--CoA ligase [Candidatus Acetothermia bacterium]|jgi:long-chain acyl-CoA synthetase|nr:long-chain fatty acid--CoA ligase [Candidatus Acetothermia bacterium]MCI2431566.1 long-chain fatty acid--CoA ligase [Candidatus Acetothermia bacterium]MCI2435660.1 long-chain fatty acid--CoA ligase [Candidatus Acetothermia bacterium]